MPPAMDPESPHAPKNMTPYRNVKNKKVLPLHESLKETIERTVPYFESVIKPQMFDGKRVIISAHGNSIRALVKYFDQLGDAEIMDVNIPTGIPLVYEFDEKFQVLNRYYLEDKEKVQEEIQKVADQGKTEE